MMSEKDVFIRRMVVAAVFKRVGGCAVTVICDEDARYDEFGVEAVREREYQEAYDYQR